jgi:hypothetical protein
MEWWLYGILWSVDQWLSGDEMSPTRLDYEYVGKLKKYVIAWLLLWTNFS